MAEIGRPIQGMGDGAPTAFFVLEQTLGHISHGANLCALVPEIGVVEPVFLPIEFDPGPRRIPGWSNWTVRAGIRAARAIVNQARSDPPVRADVMFVHTQVPAVLLDPWMRRTPTVVSIDATPKQYDELGEFYAHGQGSERTERLKHWMIRHCFERAVHLVAWSEWARQGLITQYGVAPERVTVIAPGVDVVRWRCPFRDREGPLQVLFVGNDLGRKGGDLMIDAARQLRNDPTLPQVEVHLVTAAQVDPEPGIVVHRGLTPNSPELIAQYHRADIFCLPTLGDCLPMVLAEAAAAGLPLVSTNVGAIHEIVQPGFNGELVARGDLDELVGALRKLALEPQLRRRYAAKSRELAERDHDARTNAARITEILKRYAAVKRSD